MPRPRSRNERSRCDARETHARRLRPAGEDVEPGSLERSQGREPAACERSDRAPGAAAEPPAQLVAAREQTPRALGLERQQLAQRLVRAVELGDAEAAPVLGGEIDAPELEVARD